jgi:hypothetical protein
VGFCGFQLGKSENSEFTPKFLKVTFSFQTILPVSIDIYFLREKLHSKNFGCINSFHYLRLKVKSLFLDERIALLEP